METTAKSPKFQRATEEQLNFYLDFCQQHPEINGKNNPQSPSLVQDRWRELAEHLNCMRGPTRTASKWKETLSVWKSQMRGRARAKKADLLRTGGGPGNIKPITCFEERVVSTFGKAAVDGLNTIDTLGIENIPPNRASFVGTPLVLPIVDTSSTNSDIVEPAAGSVHPTPQCSASTAQVPIGPRLEEAPPASTSFQRMGSKTPDIIELVLRIEEKRDARDAAFIEAQLATAAALEHLARAIEGKKV